MKIIGWHQHLITRKLSNYIHMIFSGVFFSTYAVRLYDRLMVVKDSSMRYCVVASIIASRMKSGSVT